MSSELVFLHIPKAAGTSQHGSFRQNYGPENVFWFGLDCPAGIRRYPRDAIGDCSIVGGHKPLSFYPADLDALFCAVLRDPVERAISLFAYYTQPELAGEEQGRVARANLLDRLRHQGIDPLSMVRSIKNCRKFREEITNTQCAYLGRNATTFEGALDSLRKEDFVVGTMKHYGKFHAYIGELLDWAVEEPPSKNRSRNDYADEYMKDTELVELIEELNQEDFRLIEHVSREHDGLYVHFRDVTQRQESLETLPLKPWKSRRRALSWDAAAAEIWPRRSDNKGLVWPVNKLMLAKQHKLLYLSTPGPANPSMSRLMLEHADLEHASAMRDLGLNRVIAKFETGLMLADYDKTFARDVRGDPSYYKFAIVNEPVSRVLKFFINLVATDLRAARDDEKNAQLTRILSSIRERVDYDPARGMSFREFVTAVLQLPPREQPVLLVPQHLALTGVNEYDKLYRQDQVVRVAADLNQRSGKDVPVPPSVPTEHSAPATTGAGLTSAGDYADTVACDLPTDPREWRDQLIDQELLQQIMDYYHEDCGLYDGIDNE